MSRLQGTARADLEDEATASAVAAALRPEALEGPEGSTLRVHADGATVHLTVEAQDVSGLRAALHSALRLLDAAWRTARSAPVQEPSPDHGNS